MGLCGCEEGRVACAWDCGMDVEDSPLVIARPGGPGRLKSVLLNFGRMKEPCRG